jgi:UDP-2,3-diacylglucosamine hydrolase
MIKNIILKPGKKAIFASDMHLGLYPQEKSFLREKRIVKWLDEKKDEIQVLFLLGDVFDFWYEYKHVIPRGYTRFLGKLCELADLGVEIHFFTGNHDVWVFDYLPKEIGLTVHRESEEFQINNKNFLIGHGDDLNPKDYGYRILKSIFTNKFLQFLFSRLHPNLAIWFGLRWSKSSRYSKGLAEEFMGENKEHQIVFAKKFLNQKHVDFFIFGHRHIAMDYPLNENSRLINLGEWIQANSFAEFDGSQLGLKYYKNS